MNINLIPILRIVQGLLALIVLGVDAYVVDFYRSNGFRAPSQAGFVVFVCVWSFLALLYLGLAPTYAPNLHNKWAVLGVEGLSVVFWFAGFVAIAAWLGDQQVCYGTVCGCARATAVFGAFSWIAWTISFILVIKAILAWTSSRKDDVEAGGVPGRKGSSRHHHSVDPHVAHAAYQHNHHAPPPPSDAHVVSAAPSDYTASVVSASPGPDTFGHHPPAAAGRGNMAMPSADYYGGRGH